MSINVHIERLVIDDPGFGPHCARELQSAVHSELVRQLQANGTHPALQTSWGSRRIDGGVDTRQNVQRAGAYGQGIGQAIFRSIVR